MIHTFMFLMGMFYSVLETFTHRADFNHFFGEYRKSVQVLAVIFTGIVYFLVFELLFWGSFYIVGLFR